MPSKWSELPEKRREQLKNAQAKYYKKAFRQIKVSLHNVSDADIIARLDSVDNKTDYIRALIRADIEKEKDAK